MYTFYALWQFNFHSEKYIFNIIRDYTVKLQAVLCQLLQMDSNRLVNLINLPPHYLKEKGQNYYGYFKTEIRIKALWLTLNLLL